MDPLLSDMPTHKFGLLISLSVLLPEDHNGIDNFSGPQSHALQARL